MQERDEQPVPFEDRRRLILGVRAAGLLLLGWGLAAPAALVGLVIEAIMVSPSTPGVNGRLGMFIEYVSTKGVLTRWLMQESLWILALCLAVYLLTRDSRQILRLVRIQR